MSGIGIETLHLKKQFGDLVAVNEIDLHVPKGSLFGFLGPNGAGKSTTISMLSTILPPTSGTAKIMGYDIVKERAKVRELIGVCPQDIVMYELLTAKENIHMVAQMHNIHPADYKERTDELLGRMGLLERKDDRVKGFSGGMKRRINVLMAVIHDPDVVFLDEPSAGLDPQSRRVVWDFIRDYGKHGKTVVLTTHNMDEADDLSDQLAIIDHGKIIAEGTPAELKGKIGAGDVIEFRLSENGVKREQIIDHLKQNQDILWAKSVGKDHLSFSALDGLKKISSFYSYFESNFHVKMNDVVIRQNTLEDVFLDLTGRALRD
jgi:ABC-2 type transport system ATP-binding protein